MYGLRIFRERFFFLTILGWLCISLVSLPVVSAVREVTPDNAHEVMIEISRQCKIDGMKLSACREYAQAMYPEFNVAPVGSIFAVTFNSIYNTVKVMPN